MESRTIAIAGSGTMGSGIAQAVAQGGFRVLLYDVGEDYLRRGISRIRERLDGRVAEGKLSREAAEEIMARIGTTTRLEDLAPAALVIEAITENEKSKTALFSELDRVCPPEAVFAS